jgi:hypothetical protein
MLTGRDAPLNRIRRGIGSHRRASPSVASVEEPSADEVERVRPVDAGVVSPISSEVEAVGAVGGNLSASVSAISGEGAEAAVNEVEPVVEMPEDGGSAK